LRKEEIFVYLLCEAEMKESIFGAEMVAHKSKAPTPKPATSLDVKLFISSSSSVAHTVLPFY
jgi:hypothetical protein